ncbi:MAG: Rieske (2Fe-2S) protein [Planctomycetaceae bacterium]|nr:Rieske (2Fe-2S) protein [Planctomycetaceae bacterium]
MHRRAALRSLLGSTLGLSLAGLSGIAGLWAAAVVRFLTPNIVRQASRTFKVGRPSEYREGQVETRYQASHGVWVVRATGAGRPQFYALRSACTHLGCATQWDDSRQQFRCPCHGSTFSKEGNNLAGPSRSPLERCAIRLADDGQLEVDAGQTVKQDDSGHNPSVSPKA